MKNNLLFILLIVLSFATGCGDDEPVIVPNVPVHVEFYLNEPYYNNLVIPLGAVKIPNCGYNNNGIIVFRNSDMGIYAYDATCPQHINTSTSVNPDENGSGTATCPHCHTVYYLTNNGYPAKGYRLKSYHVTVSGNFVSITN